ncbi:hypothetical protein [Prochlorococcus marinus]|uniref:hypothetical protein n=1 Tax=Prochlorococcus marinus TaxID=1219 RepID=UPI0039AF5B30
MNYAKKNVTFYSCVNSAFLSDFPVLTKEIIRSSFSLLHSKNYKGKTNITYSGGSTGEPVPIIHCEEYNDWTNAALYNYYDSNFELNWQNATTLEIWGSNIDIENKERTNLIKFIKNNIYSSYTYNCFVFGKSDYKRCVEIINSKRPFFLKGYVNSLLELADYITKNNSLIHFPKYILPRTATVNIECRNLLENTFHCKVVDLYGSREVSAIAAENNHSIPGEYHVFNSNNFIELDERGHILVTNFHNYSMPIIRFDIGDESSFIKNDDHQQILGPIKGRIFDYLRFKNGRNIHAQYVISMFFATSIYQFQIIQTSKESLKINYVDPCQSLKNDFIDKFQEKLNYRAGYELQYSWNKVSQVEKTPNGKFMYVKGL